MMIYFKIMYFMVFFFQIIVSSMSEVNDEDYVIKEEIIRLINDNPESTWVAGVNPRFAGRKWKDVKSMFSWGGHREEDKKKYLTTPTEKEIERFSSIPSHFDTYNKWPDCEHDIRDQGQCGSCWAFSGCEAMSDRYCIAGYDVILSPQDLVSCDYQENACDGGYLSREWIYFEEVGVCTDSCFPYYSYYGDVPNCQYPYCHDLETWTFFNTAENSTKHFGSIEEAQLSIMEEGSIQTGFNVFEDFMHYRGGVYHHQWGEKVGGHAVKIQGWGERDGEKFWLIANSWGEDWGLDGYFLMLRGHNECGVEKDMWVGSADVERI